MVSKLGTGLLVLLLPVSVVLAAKEARLDSRKLPLRQEVRESRQIRREELKVKIQSFRDERKKELATRLHERMCQVKDNRVAATRRHLQSMTNILARVEERAGRVKDGGKDVSTVTAAIDKAKAALSAAQAAIDALAGADCGVTVSGEETKLATEVRAAQRALTAQVKGIHQKVVAARHAVQEAIRALAKVLGEPLPSPVSEL